MQLQCVVIIDSNQCSFDIWIHRLQKLAFVKLDGLQLKTFTLDALCDEFYHLLHFNISRQFRELKTFILRSAWCRWTFLDHDVDVKVISAAAGVVGTTAGAGATTIGARGHF